MERLTKYVYTIIGIQLIIDRMFTFHKPKVYRSTKGCCICKAKSSSSRFTDSKKYENDFPMCFQLSSPRQGEICNACVLLVKRFKRLPVGSSRHWGHVVDARAGPGIKCMSKVKKRCEESQKNSKIDECEGSLSGEEELWSDDEPASDDDDVISCRKRKLHQPRKNNVNPVHSMHFLNTRIWKKVTVCCAEIWQNNYGQSVLDLSSLRPCPVRIIAVKQEVLNTKIQECEGTTIPGKVFNDNSSDSGYDESGNASPPQDPTVIANTNVENKKTTNNTMVIAHISGEKIPKNSHMNAVCMMVSYSN